MKNKKPKFKNRNKGATVTIDSALRTIAQMLEIMGKDTPLDCLQGLILPFKDDAFAISTIKASLLKSGMTGLEIERSFLSMREGETHVT